MHDSSASASSHVVVHHPRQDSSVEPRAYRPARWPPSSVTTYSTPSNSPPTTTTPSNNRLTLKSTTPSSPRHFPRSFTAPVSRRPPSSSSTAAASDQSDQSRSHHPPVQLTPGLSPTLRDILPHPKPVRPRPFPTHSDLSAASTRAEQEPTALRDLRRVTAPPALLDPAHYAAVDISARRRDPLQHHHHHHHLHHRRRRYADAAPYLARFHRDADILDRDFHPWAAVDDHDDIDMDVPRYTRIRNSPSSSLVTDRLSEGVRRDRWSLLSDGLRPRSVSRSSRLYKFTIKNWLFPRDKLVPPVIPDRLRDIDPPSIPAAAASPLDRSPVFRNDRHAPDDPSPTRPRPSSLDDVAHAMPIIDKRVFRRRDQTAANHLDYVNNKLGEDNSFTDDVRYDVTLDAPFPLDAQCDGALLNRDLFCEEEEDLTHAHHILKHRDNFVRPFDPDGEVANVNRLRPFDAGAGRDTAQLPPLFDAGGDDDGGDASDPRNDYCLEGVVARSGHSFTHLDQDGDDEGRHCRAAAAATVTGVDLGAPYRAYVEGDDDEHSQEEGNEQSVISALTNESDVEENMRTRSISEAVVHRRLSLVQTKDKVLSVWDRLLNRRRTHVSRRHQDSSPSPLRTSWLRFRSADTVGLNASF